MKGVFSSLIFIALAMVIASFLATTPSGLAAIGKVLSLDGEGDCVEVIQDIPEINFTIELRFRTLSPNVGVFGVLAGPSGQSGHDRHIYLKGGFLRQRIWEDETITSANPGFNDGFWHHYAMVVEQGIGQKMYVDGQIEASGSKDRSDFDWQDRFWIGFSNDARNNFFTGQIDEVRIWKIARTQEQIQGAMNRTLTSDEINSGNVVGYWNFDDGDARDLSPNGNHGTLTGDARIGDLIASFTAKPRWGEAPLTVYFTDISYSENITNWYWEFGDGRTSTEQSPIHEYQNPGDYTVSLTITSLNNYDTFTRFQYIHVGAPSEFELEYVQPTSTEFIGPLASWVNVKTDYGAVGDGNADDTFAIQRAFDALRPGDSKIKVLYFPAGVYRITEILKVIRETHEESLGITIVGEDPTTTIIKWDGPVGEVMIEYGAWYSKISRLTLDGLGKAGVALWHGPMFSSINEVSDMIFQDVSIGIQAGSFETAGQGETAVLRCKFLRCWDAGFHAQNWNSLNWYFWHCLFEYCQFGVTNWLPDINGAGNFHVYESVFHRSSWSDIYIGNLFYFSFVNNISIGSAMFFSTGFWHHWSSPVTIQGNIIIDPKPMPELEGVIWMGYPGPWFLLDNVIKRSPEYQNPPVHMGSATDEGDVIAVGNTFTVENPVHLHPSGVRYLSLEEKIVAPEEIKEPVINLPATPPRHSGMVFEVPAGATAGTIQWFINQAAEYNGQRPVVHLPAGTYYIDHTLVIPAGCDVILMGDGINYATTLNWVGGADGGPILLIKGPSHATVRDIYITHVGWAPPRPDSPIGIVVEGCDQSGGRIHMEQTITFGYNYGLIVDGLDETYVSLHDHGHNGIKVVGGVLTAQGKQTPGRTVLFQGHSWRASYHNPDISVYHVERHGRLLVRDVWYEGDQIRFMHLTDSGEFCLHSAMVAPNEYKGIPSIEIDNFSGRVLLSQISAFNAELKVTDDNENLKMLLLGWTLYPGKGKPLYITPTKGQVGLLSGRQDLDVPPYFVPIPNSGNNEPQFILEMLEPLRTQLPRPLSEPMDGVTNLRFDRVFVEGKEGIRLQAETTNRYSLSLREGMNLISVPLQPEVWRLQPPQEPWKLSDLAEYIGLADVSMIIFRDEEKGKFVTWKPEFPEESPINAPVEGGKGYIVIMKSPREVTFTGSGWDGRVELQAGVNCISMPLDPGEKWKKLSDLTECIGAEVNVIVRYDAESRKYISWTPNSPKDSPTNVVIKGGDGFIVVMKRAKSVTFTGKAWEN